MAARPADAAQLEAAIRAADVLCVVYDAMAPESFERVVGHWLPRLRAVREREVPVLLVGNGIDGRAAGARVRAQADIQRAFEPVLHAFPEVETLIECSARHLLNIHELFHYALRAVLYPLAPLYDLTARQLRPACVAALMRIFKLADSDRDGLLSDDELGALQERVFGVPLSAPELAGVKAVVAKQCADGLRAERLTLAGFTYLQYLLLLRGRAESTWAILRHFGYTDTLHLDATPPAHTVPAGHVAQLSPAGTAWLRALFAAADQDRDGGLTDAEVADIFSVAPAVPFAAARGGRTATGQLSAGGWLGLWELLALLDPPLLLQTLAALGHRDPPACLATVARASTAERALLLAFVFGAPGAGKSALLDAFVHQTFHGRREATHTPVLAVDEVMPGSFLALQEIPSVLESSYIRELGKVSPKEPCDLVVYLYDNHDKTSFMYVAELHRKLASWKPDFPSLFCATKGDLPAVEQEEMSLYPRLPPVVTVSASRQQLQALTSAIRKLVAPTRSKPAEPPANFHSRTAVAVAVALTSVIVGFFALRRLRS